MATTYAPETAAGVVLQLLALADLRESPHNPRKHFDPAKLGELAESIRKSGILTPLLVRPLAQDGVFEIAAGHRRFRAAQLAGVDEVPCVVRELDETTFLEVITIENLQREDVHPLEEADGFRSLITELRYDVATIADRVGRSHAYVYDRLRLLSLVDEARTLFFDGKITTGHAILLARIAPDDQRRAINPQKGGVFTGEQSLYHPGQEDLDLYDDEDEDSLEGMKPRSVKELQGWIDQHVRFDESAADLPDLFPETAVVVRQAAEEEEKVVKITHEHYVQPEARAEDERTISPRSWKRADGKHESKTCEHSVVGVVAIGPGRGEAFRVCIEKKKCKVHWATEQREALKRARAVTTSGTKGEDKWALERKKREEQEAREKLERGRWEKARPQLLEAFAAALKTAEIGVVGEVVLEEVKPDWGFTNKRAQELLARGTTADSLLRHAAMLVVGTAASNGYWMERNLGPFAKQLGVDVKKIVNAVAPKTPPPKEPKEKKEPVKKAAAKKRPTPKAKRSPGKRVVSSFMQPQLPDAALAAIVGAEAIPRTEVTMRLWKYIKKHGLQDAKERRMINADEKLQAVFGGKKRVSMFEMTKLINKHLAPAK